MTVMPHSELTQALTSIARSAGELIIKTSGGVSPEGGRMEVTPAPTPAPPLSPVAIVPVTENSGFVFGKTSEKELIGVHPELVEVTRFALRLSTQDFMVFDGIRSVEEQRRHVANGTSKTMKSKHLDGLAVDLVPWINGKPTWDWDGCYKIAYAMDQAATRLNCADRIVWGGAWDRTLAAFGNNPEHYKQEVEAYKVRHPGPDFIDGPHFEWKV